MKSKIIILNICKKIGATVHRPFALKSGLSKPLRLSAELLTDKSHHGIALFFYSQFPLLSSLLLNYPTTMWVHEFNTT